MPDQACSDVGTVSRSDGQTIISLAAGESGWALFGPYVELRPGRHTATYHVVLGAEERSTGTEDDVCCILDACTDGGRRILARREVTRAELARREGGSDLTFEADAPGQYEFRLFSTGKAALAVRHERDLRADTAAGSRFYNGFYLSHAARFGDLEAKGAVVGNHPDGVQVSLQGCRLWVRNAEDFQIIHEVLLQNDYNFILREPCHVLDVGMNIGLASLYFAGMPHVAEVHGFEPFDVPFRRALENFAINPDLSAKITAHPVGLGAADEAATVLYDAGNTIGVSTRGAGHGAAVTIRIRDAAAIVSEHAARARDTGRKLVVKLDCEGSEFPIFDRLHEAGLLGAPSVYLMEWHKWWSPDRTQRDLIHRLLDNGFTVLDQTNPSNPHAGALYAVRTGG